MCSITTSQRLKLWQMDFVSAFLNSGNLFEVYIEQSRDFEKERDDYIQKDHGYYKSHTKPHIRSNVIDDEYILTST